MSTLLQWCWILTLIFNHVLRMQPLDVVKILAQVGTKDTHAGFLQSFRNIHASEGIRAFWKGNGVCVLLFIPARS